MIVRISELKDLSIREYFCRKVYIYLFTHGVEYVSRSSQFQINKSFNLSIRTLSLAIYQN